MRRVTPFIVLVVLVLAACGGGGGSSAKSSSSKSGKSSSSDGKALSEKEFKEQANKICKDGEAALERRQAKAALDRPETEGGVEFQRRFFLEEGADAIEAQLDAIDELDAPDKIADDVDKLIKDARKALKDFVKELEDNPEPDLSENPFEDIDRQSTALGLDECAS
jgi:hypothetical protein